MSGADNFRERMQNYMCDGNKAVSFFLVRHSNYSKIIPSLIENRDEKPSEDCMFHPEMCHQVFGESEHIFGYTDLKVNICYSASKLNAFLHVSYSETLNDKDGDVQPDDIDKILKDHLPKSFTTSEANFAKLCAKDSEFQPPGELLDVYTVEKNNTSRSFDIYFCDSNTSKFDEYHEKMETFLLWFIDAAQYINLDSSWRYYLIFEVVKDEDKPPYRAFVGFMSVYLFYAYPANVRPRISQVLILPPFQRQGHGSRLLQTFYNHCQSMTPKVVDITVEDPVEEFQRVRDFTDCLNCLQKFPQLFKKISTKTGLTGEISKEAFTKLFINKKQIRRVFEILLLFKANVSDPIEMKKYRLFIKRRLYLPFQKEDKKKSKLSLSSVTNGENNNPLKMSQEEIHDHLDLQFSELLDQYTLVVKRLNSADL